VPSEFSSGNSIDGITSNSYGVKIGVKRPSPTIDYGQHTGMALIDYFFSDNDSLSSWAAATTDDLPSLISGEKMYKCV